MILIDAYPNVNMATRSMSHNIHAHALYYRDSALNRSVDRYRRNYGQVELAWVAGFTARRYANAQWRRKQFICDGPIFRKSAGKRFGVVPPLYGPTIPPYVSADATHMTCRFL